MEVTKTLKPGDKGTARLLREYGDRLVCVRYRFDQARNKNLTTVELIVDKHDAFGGYVAIKKHQSVPKLHVVIRTDFHETELREKAKHAKGT